MVDVGDDELRTWNSNTPYSSEIMLRAAACCLLLLPLFTSGCALCTSCDDDNFSAYGGRWERDIANHGRVLSAFEPAAHLVDGGEFVVEQPTPATVDENHDMDDAGGDDAAGDDAAGDDAG
jgi:hypothetical protein